MVAVKSNPDNFLEWVEWGLEGGEGVYRNITMPLVHALQEIEHNGVLIDQEQLYVLDQKYHEKILDLERKFWNIAGSDVKYTSADQLRNLLYNELGLPVVLTSKKTGQPSTALGALEKLQKAHPVVPILIDLKKTVKVKKDFLCGWGKTVGITRWIQPDGRIHPNYKPDGTDSGRVSSFDPNDQNVTRESEIRSLYTVAEGNVWGEADYAQLELFMTASMAGDAKMLEAISMDMHQATAAFMFNIPYDKVTSKQRSLAKAINFGIVYGMSAYSLSFRLDISEEQAEEYIEAWFSAYRYVRRWLQMTRKHAMNHGYVESLYGRRRHLPDLKNPNKANRDWKKVRSHQLRVATNFPVQSSGSDSLSLSTIQMVLFPDDGLRKMGVKFIKTLHDAVHFEVPERHAIDAAERIQYIMKTVPSLVLGSEYALRSDVKLGRHWGDDSFAVLKAA